MKNQDLVLIDQLSATNEFLVRIIKGLIESADGELFLAELDLEAVDELDFIMEFLPREDGYLLTTTTKYRR